jgi:hypothetical protein
MESPTPRVTITSFLGNALRQVRQAGMLAGYGRLVGGDDVGGAFGQFLAEAALVELGHQRALQIVALVEEGQPEGEAHIA